MNYLIFFLPFLFFLTSCSQNTVQKINASQPITSPGFYAIIPDSIYDGDTFRVMDETGQEIKIRLCGIDAPEMSQSLGTESRDYLRSLLNQSINGRVHLNIADTDRYGRTVAEVFVPISQEEEIAVNGEMLLAGMAYHYKQYSGNCFNGHLYESYELEAKEAKKGIWEDSRNIPPWEYRRMNK